MYVAMGKMLTLPLPPFLDGVENGGVFVFAQILLVLPILYVNRKFFIVGFRALIKKAPNMDSLIAVGSTSALAYSIFSAFVIFHSLGHSNFDLAHKYLMNLHFEGAGMILTLVTVGKLLEERSKNKTGEAITKLIDLSPKEATCIRNGKEVLVKTEDILVGDIIVIRPGEKIPVDGVVIEGSSSVDKSALTGESIPVDVTVGSEVISASINKNGYFKMKATKVGANTTLAQIIDLVESANATKAPIARIADKVAGVFVPAIITLAVLVCAIWVIVGQPFSFAIERAIGVLVISCPCALGLATPVAITVATGRCAKKGILVKSAEALETLHSIDTVVLDKTGTITEGKPKVCGVYPCEISADELIKISASLEKQSEHPLAEAILSYAHDTKLYEVQNFTSVSGRGITGEINGTKYYGGNLAFMSEQGIDVSGAKDSDGTPMYFAKENQFIGVIYAMDTVKESSFTAISDMQKMGLSVVMLTGDSKKTAEVIKNQLNLTDVIAEVMPADKEKAISTLQSEGKKVLMVGDGINDSPALAKADVGIAIGSGTDIAIDSADLVLMKSNLNDVCEAISFSKKTLRVIKQNLFWAFFYNVLAIPVAAGVLYAPFGITLSPMIGAAAMSFSSIFVTLNALRLYKK